MKLFLKKLLFIFPIPLIVILTNYFVDPANIFNERYEQGIVEYLVQGYNVTNVLNYNERILQKHFIEKLNKCPTVIALGASRIMQFNKVLVKDENFINNGVSGASLEDVIAIFFLYEKKGCKIKKVILNLEPYMLNDNHEQVRWKSLETEYNEMYSKILHKKKINSKFSFNKFDNYKELISFSYFNTSLKYLFRGINIKYIPTKNNINDGFTRLTDGSIHYDSKYRNSTFSEVEQKAKSTIANDPISSLGKYTELSLNYELIFDSFIDYLQNKGVIVEFFLAPYHPIVYDYLKSKKYYQIVFKADDYYRKFAVLHNIKVVGSYNPIEYNLDNTCFLDGYHCKEEAIVKILNN